jgi:hypothetical protein
LVELFAKGGKAMSTPGNTAAAPSAATTTDPVARDPASDDAEGYGRAIGERIRSDFAPMAEGCYRELLGRTPKAEGTVIMQFEILSEQSIGGVVNGAELADESTLRDPEFDTCLRESFRSLDFDTLRSRQRATLRFPFEFANGKVDASHEIHLNDKR